jgi:hypothetical protein
MVTSANLRPERSSSFSNTKQQEGHIAREGVSQWNTIEEKLNYLIAMVDPVFFGNALAVRSYLRSRPETQMVAEYWQSIYPCLSIISNGMTPEHRDNRGEPNVYDMLLNIGTSTDLKFNIPELKIACEYTPGTVIFIYGHGLGHEVPKWGMGERCGYAHFIRGSHFEDARRAGYNIKPSKWAFHPDTSSVIVSER